MKTNSYSSRHKIFFFVFIIGFLFKYNYLMLEIFHVPVLLGILLRNIVFLIFFFYFYFPLVQKKRWRITTFIVLLLFTIFFISNYWYAGYFGNYLSYQDMGKGGNLLPVLEMIYHQIFRLWHLLFFLDLGLLIFFIKDRKYYFTYYRREKKKKKLVPVLLLTVLLIFQVFLSNYILGGYNHYNLYQMDSGAFVNVYGLLPLYGYEYYLERNIKKNQNQMTKKEVTPPSILTEEKMDGERVGERLNIIAIQVESLDKKIIDYEYNGQEVTPFLNGLKRENLFVEDFFAQHVNGSFDADFSFLTSLYPVNKSYAFNENDMTAFNSLLRVLKDQGYSTAAFHGNRKTFFHRDKAYPDLGFDRFYGLSDYHQESKKMEIRNEGLGINDYDFFDQSVDYLKELENPFFAFLITVSSHGPFKHYPSDWERDEFKDIDNQLVQDYFQSIYFVDRTLEMFYQKLEEIGLLDNSLLIIYGDHEAGIEEKEYSSSNYFISGKDSKLLEQVPLIISYPGVEAGTIEKVGSMPDLAPTILDLIGYEKKPSEFAGQSLLGSQDKPIIFLHERPLLIFKRQIYEQEGESFISIASLDGTVEEGRLSRDREDETRELIEFLRSIMALRRPKI
ncbi:MAG: LTA synthase family protein [Halothermotrichaceae bacterium]